MEIVGDTRTGTVNVMGFTSHCFDSYIDVNGNDVLTVEVRDGDSSGALLTQRKFDPESGNYIGTSPYDDYQGYMLKGNGTYDAFDNCCGVSVGGFEISKSKLIVVGTTIDQKNISTSRTRNVFLAVADKQTELEDRMTFQEHTPGNDDGQISDITMLTSYEEGTPIAYTPQLVPMDNDRYLIIWSRGGPLYPGDDEEQYGTVYYQMIDGNGNLIGNQYSFQGVLSDCQPIIYNGSILWYTRNFGEMTFYSINANDISKNSVKTIPLVKEHFNTEIDCFTPATFTESGLTGYPMCHDCGKNLDSNHTVDAFGSCDLVDDTYDEYNKFVYTGKKINVKLDKDDDIKEGVDYKLDLPENVVDVGTYSATVTLMGNYTGSKSVKFKVIPAYPSFSIKALKRKIKIKIKKPASSYGADQFQIKYKTKGKKWKTVNTASRKKVLKKLKKGEKYTVKIRTFKKVDGKTYYSWWYYNSAKVK